MTIQRGTSPINVYRGDAYTWQYQMVDVDDDSGIRTVIDITNFDITGQVRYTADNDTVWFTLPIVKSDPVNGIFEWTLTETASKNLLPPGATTPSSAVYDIQLRIPNADPNLVRVLTFLTGTFAVSTDVTRT
ncbi:hypothetical protein VPDG_00122 [Vibrio phage henriette 12B8]|uniref:hypothetical protein n=1 Tax=Vibrio phage henriette 12B8 TaxID=573174 RepID=UPI0002C09F73|nr:hypothetical protein VPDG_00122 [Vibrio phage henriette 12B8]AGG58283.1 hypothetical protein VPDG_00122 [Vibrio phage henriette 12B8]